MNKFGVVGLTNDEVELSRKNNGQNNLPPPDVEGFWEKLLEKFGDPLIRILMVALVITLGLSFLGYAEWAEGVGIAIAVFLASFVATYSEYKNENSFQKLQEEASLIKNTVIRNGLVVSIFVSEVVQGDYVLLQPGDKVPADGPMIKGDVSVNEMAINGEPFPKRKLSLPKGEEETYIIEKNSYVVFRGAVVEEGEGVMIAKKIGINTVYGSMINDIANSEKRESPLELKLKDLADGISQIGYIGAIFIALSFLFKQFVMDQNYNLDNTITYLTNWQLALKDSVTALILAIIIIVVAVPEGLPMMIAIVLYLNMGKLLQSKVLVRKLMGIETSGSLSILFSDKTGTITKGHLQPYSFITGDLKEFRKFHDLPEELRNIIGFTLKHSSLSFLGEGDTIVGGNPSERAFLSYVDSDYLKLSEDVTRVKEILFSSQLKFSCSMVESKKNDHPIFAKSKYVTLYKGAPEKLLEKCKSYYGTNGKVISIPDTKFLEDEVTALSSKGIRVVAYATSNKEITGNEQDIPSELTFAGLICLRDEIRDESPQAIQDAINAGIQVVMITGDRKETAISVARQVGLIPHTIHPENIIDESTDTHLPKNSVLTSEDLQKMSDDDVRAILKDLRVVARALPSDKSRLVEISQSLNLVVGMTGDGVNDAAALYKADVGFAMGSGTEFAKESSDIVILDDNFNSISKAILYGRTIFKTIRKFITFQSTINMASTLIVFIGPFLGFDFPLTLIQLLWVNLVMDTLAALAFGGEPALERYMKDIPVNRNEKIVSPYMWTSIILNGSLIAILSIVFLLYGKDYFLRNGVHDEQVFLTAFFAFYIFITTINAFNVRTPNLNIFDNISGNTGFFGVIILIFAIQIIFTYVGGNILRTVPLYKDEWIKVIGGAFVIIPFDLLRKLIFTPLLPKSIIEQPTEKSEK